nr:unnamed protein product [Callosobruchus analis]
MGSDAEEILLQKQTSGNETFQQILQIFENHFIPRRNLIFERFQFNSRVQKPGEPVGNFITSLHALVEHCNFGTLKKELIRDRIVIGIADTKVCERMQLDDSLTLNKAVLLAHQTEMQDKQNKIETGTSSNKCNPVKTTKKSASIVVSLLVKIEVNIQQGLHLVEHVTEKVIGVSEGDSIVSRLSLDTIAKKIEGIFSEIGEFKTEISIKIKPDAKPYVQKPIEEPTTWVSPIVCVDKGECVRLCCDYTKLNKSVLRSHFPLPKIEHTHTTSGFYQIRLSKESQLLTTFITAYGRFFFKSLPFGISCAPEYFAMRFSKILNGIEEFVIHMNDILIHASTIEKHDEILTKVLTKLHEEGITLNRMKCHIASKSTRYLGHIVSEKGILIDPDGVRAIQEFAKPQNKTEDKALSKVKELLQSPPILAFFGANKTIIISADTSGFGIGACLMKESQDKSREIIAFAS